MPFVRVCECENAELSSDHDGSPMINSISIQAQTAVFLSLDWQWGRRWSWAKSRESDKQMRQELQFPWNLDSGDTNDGVFCYPQRQTNRSNTYSI